MADSVDELLDEIRRERAALVKAGKIKKSKPLPKISDEDIPFAIPEHWRWVRLGEIGNWGSGGTPTSTNETYYVNGTIPWIKSGDLNDGDIFTTEEKITEEGVQNSNAKLKKKDSVVIALYGATIGKTGILRIDATTNQACCVCELFTGVYNKYLNNYLISQREGFRRIASGGTQPNISREKVVVYPFPLPPLSEQKEIVAILDELFAKIDKAKANLEKNLENVEELYQRKLSEYFSNENTIWEEVPLEKYISLIDYRGRTPEKTKEGVRLITAKNVKLGYLQKEPQEFIAADNYEAWMRRGIPNFGDVIFTTEAPLGNVAQIDTYEKLAFAQRIIVMQPAPEKFNQTFLKYMLLSPVIRERIFEKETGATVTGIKSKLLKKIPIPLPPLEEQKAIVAALDELKTKTDALKDIYKQKLLGLEEMRKTVLEMAFRGGLV